jgi:hypothetical protein
MIAGRVMGLPIPLKRLLVVISRNLLGHFVLFFQYSGVSLLPSIIAALV